MKFKKCWIQSIEIAEEKKNKVQNAYTIKIEKQRYEINKIHTK